MDENSTDDSPPPTLPPNLPLTLMGFTDDQESTQQLIDEVSGGLIEISRFFDLERLAGVTIGFDFGVALDSVDLGFESTIAKSYTNDGEIVAVAKSLNVLREGRPMAHVVYSAQSISPLIAPEHPGHNMAMYIFAHELGHVVELKWRDEAMPGMLLQARSPTFVDGLLLQVATACWEEYAACRLSANFGKPDEQLSAYAQNLDKYAKKALSEAQSFIKEFRSHADVEKLLLDTSGPLGMPFKLAGYLFGHIDGLNGSGAKWEDLCPAVPDSIYGQLLPEIWSALRKLWDTRSGWKSVGIFDDLLVLVKRCFEAAGINIKEEAEGRHYIDVPFSAATLPNGEADMAQIRLQTAMRGLFSLWKT